MKIYKIEFSKEKPYTQKLDNMILSAYFSSEHNGYWIVYADVFLSESEVFELIPK